MSSVFAAAILTLLLGAAAAPPPPEPTAEKAVPEAELAELFGEWRARQAELKTIRTRFTCTEDSALLAEPEVTGGVISILKPDGYRRELLEKKGQKEIMTGLMVLKPPRLWVYVPEHKRAEEFDLAKIKEGGGAKNNPLKALGDIISFDPKRVNRCFKVSGVEIAEGRYRLDYQPLEEEAIGDIVGVRVWIDKNGRFPLKMEFSTADGDVRTEAYQETEFDVELDEKLFTFKPPRGVSLVKVAE